MKIQSELIQKYEAIKAMINSVIWNEITTLIS